MRKGINTSVNWVRSTQAGSTPIEKENATNPNTRGIATNSPICPEMGKNSQKWVSSPQAVSSEQPENRHSSPKDTKSSLWGLLSGFDFVSKSVV